MTSTPSSSKLHHRLRQATRLSHHALDHHPLLAPLVRTGLSLDAYGAAIEALHGVHTYAERGILAFLGKHPLPFDYAPRRQIPALESDLAALGRTPVRLAVDFFPVPQSIGALVGVLYVLEGSERGGQVIARILRELPLTNLPTAFFSGYGSLSHQRWDEFLHFAETQCPADEQEIAAATAVSMFEAIQGYLDAYRSHPGQS